MSSDAASGSDSARPDGEPEQPAGAAFDGDLWADEVADALGDPVAANWFSAELENVNASDWEVGAELIWGDDEGDAAGDADAGLGLDFPV